MATLNFDTVFPAELIGEVRDIVVTDKDNTPNRALQKGMPWNVEVNWHVMGNGANTLGGQWHVQLNLESMGEGFEGKIAEKIKDYTAVEPPPASTPTHRHWKHLFENLDTKFLDPPINQGAEEGIFRLIVIITYKDPFGSPAAMAGSLEGPLLTFYKAA